MRISIKDVEYVAQLSRLLLSQEEKERFVRDLNNILEYADRITQIDTENVEPTTHVFPVSNVFREDKVRPSLDLKQLLENAPDVGDGAFKVPMVVE